MLSSETLIGSILIKQGVSMFEGPRGPEEQAWTGSPRHEMEEFSKKLFSVRSDDSIVVLVDRNDMHHVVASVEAVDLIWRTTKIKYGLVVRKDTFEAHRGDISFAPVLQPA